MDHRDILDELKVKGVILQNENRKNYFSCPNCNVDLDLKDSFFEAYFNSENIVCPLCKNRIDLWEIFVGKLIPPILSFAGHYSLLGCVNNTINKSIITNQKFDLDLTEEIGDGELLYVNITPGVDEGKPNLPWVSFQSVFPINWFYRNKKIHIEGIPLEPNSVETNWNIYYWFAPKEIKDDLSNMLLLDAFRSFYDENYRNMIISAHSSVEILYYQFFEKLLTENDIHRDKIGNFLKNAATYGYQLSTLLPLISKIEGFPLLNDKILEGLKNLKDARNDLLHRGITDTSDEVMLKRELISAFFAFKYFKIVLKIDD